MTARSEPRGPEPPALDPLEPIPLVVLSGFLGAGKTTRLNRWLKHPALADTLVIINEYGPVGLDHLLVEDAPGEIVLLAAGCLCCSLRGDLVATLEDLLRRRDNRRSHFFRRIILETSGLADPAPILQSVLQHPYLSKRFALAGIVTLVDAVNGVTTLGAHAEARRQVALADDILITKADLADAAALAALTSRLAALNPVVHPIEDDADFAADALFTSRFTPGANDGHAVARWLGEGERAGPSHAAPGAAADGIETFAFLAADAVSERALAVFREALRVLHGPKLLRVKGIVQLKDDPSRPGIIHHVQSVAHPLSRLPHWPGRDRRTRMVFITQGLSRAVIEKFWAALLATDRD